jgi:hypothetical protein
VDGHGDHVVDVAPPGVFVVQRRHVRRDVPREVLGVVAAGDETLPTEVLLYLRVLSGLLVLLLLLHLQLQDEEGPGTRVSLLLPCRFADCDSVAAAAPPIWERDRILLLHLVLRNGVREDRRDDDTDRAGPEEDELEDNELVVLLGFQREGGVGDGGDDSDFSSLGPPLRRPSRTTGRVRSDTPLKWMRPSCSRCSPSR